MHLGCGGCRQNHADLSDQNVCNLSLTVSCFHYLHDYPLLHARKTRTNITRYIINAVRLVDHNRFFFLNHPANLESFGIETDLETEDDALAVEGGVDDLAGALCSVLVTR